MSAYEEIMGKLGELEINIKRLNRAILIRNIIIGLLLGWIIGGWLW